MRVLHVVHTLNPSGGGAVEAARLYAVHSNAEYEVEVLGLDRDSSPWMSFWPVPVHAAGPIFTRYRYAPRLTRWLKDNAMRFDAVVVHGVWHYHLPAVAAALRDSGTPYFVILHGMLNPWFKRTYPMKHAKKLAFWHALVRPAIRDAAAVLFLCEEERRLAQQVFDIPARAEAIVPLGTRPKHVSPELLYARFPELRSKKLLLFLGRICSMKGCDLLLSALSTLAQSDPDVHLILAGPDEEGREANLRRQAQRSGLAERITWAGPLYSEMKWSAMRAADLFVLPSRCETFPISVLEALSCGTPVLITTDVNIWPEVRQANAGYVCATRVDDVRDCVARWLAASASEKLEYRQRAYTCSIANYDPDDAFRKHVAALVTHAPHLGSKYRHMILTQRA